MFQSGDFIYLFICILRRMGKKKAEAPTLPRIRYLNRLTVLLKLHRKIKSYFREKFRCSQIVGDG